MSKSVKMFTFLGDVWLSTGCSAANNTIRDGGSTAPTGQLMLHKT